MITSMTGFGRSEVVKDQKKITVEIKSVNHRYLDIGLHMPRRLNLFDSEIRRLLQQYMKRGKVDVNISFRDEGPAEAGLKYNAGLAAMYAGYIKEIGSEFGADTDFTAIQLARFPDVLTMEDPETDEEELLVLVEKAVSEAAQALVKARQTEGEALKEDLLKKLDVLYENAVHVEERYPQIIEEYRSKLLAKLAEVKADTSVDDSRLAAELVLYSDRLCTDEETVRLKNHIAAMQQTLEKGGEAGRKLDFMAQEMNREANTILSKANDFRTSELGIALKTDIEKIREQIQNIE